MGAALLGAAENAHADAIGDAAAKLSKAAYPFMKEVPWNSYLYNLNPGSKDAVAWAKAVGKMIDMGASMDTKLLKAGADAHHAAIGGLPASGVCSEAQLTAINAAFRCEFPTKRAVVDRRLCSGSFGCCGQRPRRCDRRCRWQAFESSLSVHEGGPLELLSLLHEPRLMSRLSTALMRR